MLYFLYTLTFFTFRITNFKIFIMRNLLLVVAFMLSIGVFAQKPVEPYDPPILCKLIYDFIPDCVLNIPIVDGVYILEVCGKDLHKTADDIQIYICENGKFPDYARIYNYKPTPQSFAY